MKNIIVSLLLVVSMSACQKAEKTFMVGTLERDRVELKVETNEPILDIEVMDGQSVEVGDLILQQDPQRQQAQLAQQQALRNQAAARLSELLRGPRPEAIEQGRAQLQAAKVQSRNTKAEYERARVVFARKLSSQATLDNTRTRWQTAVATEQAANESLRSLLNGTTTEELEQAQAVVDASEAAVQLAQINLERLNIYAPVAGRLEKRLYQLGERPPPGATVAVILDAARIYARIYVPENQKSHVQVGNKLQVRIDGVDKVFKGQVTWVSSDATFTPYFALTEHDRGRLSYLAEIDISGADSLPSGLPLEVNFPDQK